MRNIYYLFWVDSIVSFRKFNPNKRWKLPVFILNTWLNALNFWILILWLDFFDLFKVPDFNIDLFPGHILNSFLEFAILFASPFVILNYFLIFYNRRYEMLIEKYNTMKTRYALTYGMVITFLALFSAFFYDWLNN